MVGIGIFQKGQTLNFTEGNDGNEEPKKATRLRARTKAKG